MNEIWIVILILVGIFWIFRPRAFQRPKIVDMDARDFQHFQLRNSIFVNSGEKALYHILVRSAPRGVNIYPKVRLEDIIHPKSTLKDAKLRWKLRGRVKSRHIDFVICDDMGTFLCALELDGKTHRKREIQKADEFKSELCKNVGLPLYRVQGGDNFQQFCQNLWREIGQELAMS